MMKKEIAQVSRMWQDLRHSLPSGYTYAEVENIYYTDGSSEQRYTGNCK